MPELENRVLKSRREARQFGRVIGREQRVEEGG